MAYDGQRLDFGEVDFVETENAEHLRERAFLVGQGKNDAALVGLFLLPHGFGLPWIGQYEEAREVVLVVLNAPRQDFQAVDAGRIGVAHGGVPAQLLSGYLFRRAGRVVGFHELHPALFRQEAAALGKGHGVGVYFAYVVGRVFGQAHQAMLYVQLVLTHDAHAALAQKLVVVEQAAGDGVFNRHHTEAGAVDAHLPEHVLERIAAHEPELLSFEILMGGNVVERTANALDGYLFHAVLFQNKKSRFFVGSGTELLYGQMLCLARAFPLRFTEQSKSKSRKTVRCVP